MPGLARVWNRLCAGVGLERSFRLKINAAALHKTEIYMYSRVSGLIQLRKALSLSRLLINLLSDSTEIYMHFIAVTVCFCAQKKHQKLVGQYITDAKDKIFTS